MSKCVINGCEFVTSNNFEKIKMFSLPKNKELQNKWFEEIDSTYTCEKLQKGSQICSFHFENPESKIPTLNLHLSNKRLLGSTLYDYEELLSAMKPTFKKKRGTHGLKNLLQARKKKQLRRERMKKLAEKRRQAKAESESSKSKSVKAIKPTTPIYDISKDYFLGNRSENINEKIIISLRLAKLMKHLHSGKTTLCKHPASIRDVNQYPIFNKIKNIEELLNPDNPVNWNKNQVQIFLSHYTNQKAILKKFDKHDIDGEALLNLSQQDLLNYFEVDINTATQLSATFEQLKKETIQRYVNS